MPSPLVLIEGNSSAGGYNAEAEDVVNIALADSAGANVWMVECIGTDENHETTDPTISVSQVTKEGTITLPTGDGTFIFRSTVNPNSDTSTSTTFGIFVPLSGLRKFAVGLGSEGSQAYGQIPLINALVDSVAAGGGGGVGTAGDGLTLTGSDFDIDTSDTTIFTSAGAASRVPVLSASSILSANGVDKATALTFGTVSATGITIGSAGITTEITGTLTNNGSPIGGSYTAGDGLTLTGSDFDVDLSDTTIFSSAGVASRVPVLSASSILSADGLDKATAIAIGGTSSTGLTLGRAGAATTIEGLTTTVKSAGTIGLRPTGYVGNMVEISHSLSESLYYSPITSRFQSGAAIAFQAGTSVAFIGTNARFYNGSSQELLQINDLGSAAAEIKGTNSLTLAAGVGGTARITLPDMTGDVSNAPIVAIKGANASATASTAARKRGGSISIEAGRGTTPGTDPAGKIYIGCGEQVAAYSEGVFFGSGAAVGTPGAPDYVPYTDYAGRISPIGGAGRMWITANNHMTFGVEVGACGIDMNTSTTVINATTINVTPSTSFLASSQDVTVQGSTYVLLNASGGSSGIYLRSSDRLIRHQSSDEVVRIMERFPADVATASTAKVALCTVAIATGRTSTFRGSVSGWPASGAGQHVNVFFHAENIGGTVSIIGSVLTSAGASLGTVTAEVSTTNVVVYVEPLAGTSYTWRCTLIEER